MGVQPSSQIPGDLINMPIAAVSVCHGRLGRGWMEPGHQCSVQRQLFLICRTDLEGGASLGPSFPTCSSACHGRVGCRRPPQLQAASHWEAWGVAGGCLWGPEACTHGPPAVKHRCCLGPEKSYLATQWNLATRQKLSLTKPPACPSPMLNLPGQGPVSPSQGGPLTPLEDRSRAHWGPGWGHHG